MTTKYLSPVGHGWVLGTAFSGAKLYTYQAGTTTNKATYKDNAGAASHTNPIVLDGNGAVPGGAVWLDNDTDYKFTLKDSTDATTYWTLDNQAPIPPFSSTTPSEWISGTTPTYISANSFSVDGDYTGTLQVGRRLRLTDASTLYATVSAASFASSITTVTVVVDGGGSLSASLASFEYGILASTSRSIPRGPMQSAALSDAAANLEVWREYTITPTTTRVLTLPTTQVQAGDRIRVINLATDGSATTINASGGSAKVSFTNGAVELYALQALPTTPAHWGLRSVGQATDDVWSSGTPATELQNQAGTIHQFGGGATGRTLAVGGLDAISYIDATGTAGTDNTAQTVKTITLPANALNAVGRGIRIRALVKPSTGTDINAILTVNGVTVASYSAADSNYRTLIAELWYIDATHVLLEDQSFIPGTVTGNVRADPNLAGFDHTSAQDIDLDQSAAVGTNLTVHRITVEQIG